MVGPQDLIGCPSCPNCPDLQIVAQSSPPHPQPEVHNHRCLQLGSCGSHIKTPTLNGLEHHVLSLPSSEARNLAPRCSKPNLSNTVCEVSNHFARGRCVPSATLAGRSLWGYLVLSPGLLESYFSSCSLFRKPLTGLLHLRQHGGQRAGGSNMQGEPQQE